ncbi:Cellulose biosynthesis protein BcsQ [Rhodospirillales bacterium URHD0017]|nr:Cellulose biosynthesis protein BcsQ [Rhodospirillales bacterium URHD0017]
MFVVTFYSFKGGVGRTMALVNVAALLAKRGRRVLVVDFDLEAPGLPSYELFCRPTMGLGVVDYVTSYRASGVAPNVNDYIFECGSNGHKIWIMPAGRYTEAGYTDQLNSIDWQELYEEQSGYLMFEDLKQQWAAYDGHGFDYVLVDSRTGHTDVGGICTRQLPDAVVIMFLPNDQNINGLSPIVSSIRSERSKGQKKRIELLFCASNVPDLDDEESLLQGMLDEAKVKLDYTDNALSIVHHYGSLDLLKQATFVVSRPKSRLSKEYMALETAILSSNFSDADGALIALEKMPSKLDRARRQRDAKTRARLLGHIIRIREHHPDDGRVAYLAAQAFSKIGEETLELDALSTAIDASYEVNRARLGRAFLYSASQRRTDAIAELRKLLTSPTATVFELAPALRLLQQVDLDWVDFVRPALDSEGRDFKTLFVLSQIASTDRAALEAVATRMEQCLESRSLDEIEKKQAHNAAVLSLIGFGHYERAMRLIERGRPFPATDSTVVDVFNYAVAQWGQTGNPSKNVFVRVTEQFKPAEPDANEQQCLALSYSVIGNKAKTLEALALATHNINWKQETVFSCWRYLNVPPQEMHKDLTEMETKASSGEALVPAFFEEIRRNYH